MTYWRQAGITYLRFSAISAQLVRAALKQEFKVELPKRSALKQTLWKDGKPMRTDV